MLFAALVFLTRTEKGKLEQMTDPNRDTHGVFMSDDLSNAWLQTASGEKVSVLDPQEDEIKIEDIATALSKQCRYNGHCNQFYSVAQHCVLGVDFIYQYYTDLGPEKQKALAKYFLLHDASEAYLGDMIKPVKVVCRGFQEIEDKFETVIARKFNLNLSLYKEMKWVDRFMLSWEKRDLLPNSKPWPDLVDVSTWNLPVISCYKPREAEIGYLSRFKELGESVNAK